MADAVLAAKTLSAIPGVAHAFFTRQGGVSSGIYDSLNAGLGSADDPERVAENRRRMARHLGDPAGRLTTPHQIHSPDAVVVTAPWVRAATPRADAVATAVPGLVIGISIADCCPVLFADPMARVVGAAHAGWKGALGGVLESTLAAMERLGAERGRVVAALGPCIRQESYEVGPDFRDRFLAESPDSARFFTASGADDRPRFDLPGYVAARLAAAGVEAVEDLGLDTYADEDRFFSYRRMTHRGEPDYGRHVAAIALGA